MFNNNLQNRLRDLEQENQQWQEWYLSQQMTQYPPQYAQPMQQQPAKKKGKKNSRSPKADISNEAKMWIIIGILSLFAVLIIKDWYINVKQPPERVGVEQKKTKKTY